MATSMCKFCLGRLSHIQKAVHGQVRMTYFSSKSSFSSSQSEENEEFVKFTDPQVDEVSQDIIDEVRNVSRLPKRLQRKINKYVPTVNDELHNLKVQRRLYGRFGNETNFNPQLCWPSRSELREEIELEKEFEPTFQEMMENIQKRKQQSLEKQTKREEKVAKNLEKMSGWIEEYHNKQTMVKEEKRKRQEKREKLLLEAQEYFGYKVDPRDAKFQEMLEAKEKEEKKLAKKKKKELRDARFKASLQEQAEGSENK